MSGGTKNETQDIVTNLRYFKNALEPDKGLIPVHIVSTCHCVNPHGRGQVDGEDERSEGARQVHLKTVS